MIRQIKIGFLLNSINWFYFLFLLKVFLRKTQFILSFNICACFWHCHCNFMLIQMVFEMLSMHLLTDRWWLLTESKMKRIRVSRRLLLKRLFAVWGHGSRFANMEKRRHPEASSLPRRTASEGDTAVWLGRICASISLDAAPVHFA